MKKIGWCLFGGIFAAFMWLLAGVALCITIIGIPYGFKCFKVAGFVLDPYEKDIDILYFGENGLIKQLLWLGLVGWELVTTHIICALVCAITIVGIPFAKQHLKLVAFAFIPFNS